MMYTTLVSNKIKFSILASALLLSACSSTEKKEIFQAELVESKSRSYVGFIPQKQNNFLSSTIYAELDNTKAPLSRELDKVKDAIKQGIWDKHDDATNDIFYKQLPKSMGFFIDASKHIGENNSYVELFFDFDRPTKFDASSRYLKTNIGGVPTHVCSPNYFSQDIKISNKTTLRLAPNKGDTGLREDCNFKQIIIPNPLYTNEEIVGKFEQSKAALFVRVDWENASLSKGGELLLYGYPETMAILSENERGEFRPVWTLDLYGGEWNNHFHKRDQKTLSKKGEYVNSVVNCKKEMEKNSLLMQLVNVSVNGVPHEVYDRKLKFLNPTDDLLSRFAVEWAEQDATNHEFNASHDYFDGNKFTGLFSTPSQGKNKGGVEKNTFTVTRDGEHLIFSLGDSLDMPTKQAGKVFTSHVCYVATRL
ncbi:hypothetical protein [Alteromonas sp. S167]|uniref:hypothetical protein n=1 Tax=Alteromonas sp. S167 TaxID=3117402 RepID=UPI002FE1110A